MPADPHRALFDAAREGDDVAVRELVRQTQPAVWKLCTALGSTGEEDDLVQETFLRVLRSAPSYRGEAPVLPWMLSIARRVCADHVRRRTRQRRLVDRLRLSTTDEGGTAVPTEGLDDLLAGLDHDRRDAFVLTQVVGLSYDDAALSLGVPIGTIRSRVARARGDLLDAVRQAEAH